MAGTDQRALDIFISYRREDTSGYALGFRREFTQAIPEARVFLDVDSIDSGIRWRDAIRARVGTCDVMLVLIGDEWLRRRDGVKRIDQDDDTVRFEIAQALERRETLLMPVLVEDAAMPSASELPDDVRGLCEFNAHPVHDRSYDHDLNALTERLAAIAAERIPPTPEKPTRLSDGSATGERHRVNGSEAEGIELPSRVTDRFLQEQVPGMGRKQLIALIAALRDRRWSDDEIYDQALSFSPLAPPKRIPSRVTPAWLADNVPLMKPKRVRDLVHELRRRRWSDEDIREHVLAHQPDAVVTDVPSRIYPSWLEKNAPLMLPEFQQQLAGVLAERGWGPDEIARYLPDAVQQR